MKVGLAGLAQMDARFVSAFTSAGINQTRHRILIEVHAGFRILTPFGGEDREIVSTYPVTDTVIVGTVPERYAYIGGSGSDLLGEIRDYEEKFGYFSRNRKIILQKISDYLVYLICVSICSHQRSFIMDVREQITALRSSCGITTKNTITRTRPRSPTMSTTCCSVSFARSRPSIRRWQTRTLRPSGSAAASSRFAKVTHAYPLESLQDVFSFDELGEFYSRVENAVGQAEYVVEYKIDGLSVALEYVDGEFVRGRHAVTVRWART